MAVVDTVARSIAFAFNYHAKEPRCNKCSSLLEGYIIKSKSQPHHAVSPSKGTKKSAAVVSIHLTQPQKVYFPYQLTAQLVSCNLPSGFAFIPVTYCSL